MATFTNRDWMICPVDSPCPDMSLRLSYRHEPIAFDAASYVEADAAAVVLPVAWACKRARRCSHHHSSSARELVELRAEQRIDRAIAILRHGAGCHRQRELADHICPRELESDQLAF